MKLTNYSKKIEFEKLALKVMINQGDEFCFNDIFQIMKANCEEDVPTEYLIEIVDNAFGFCLNDAYIDIYAAMQYVVNLNKRQEFEDFINGIVVTEHSI